MPTAPPPEVAEQSVDVPRARVRVWRAGEGPPLLVVTDCGDPLELWAEAFGAFARRHEVTCIEQPGFGYSDAGPDFDYRWQSHLDALLGVVDELDVEDALAVGHCVGGTQLQAIAAHEPGRLRAAVLAETFPAARYRALGTGLVMHRAARVPGVGEALLALGGGRGVRGGARVLLRRLAADPGWVDNEILERYTAPVREGHNPKGGLWHNRRWNGEAAVAAERVELPAAYLLGTGGHFARFEAERRAFAAEHGREVEVLPGAGHFLFAERPEEFADRCATMLAALVGEGSGR